MRVQDKQNRQESPTVQIREPKSVVVEEVALHGLPSTRGTQVGVAMDQFPSAALVAPRCAPSLVSDPCQQTPAGIAHKFRRPSALHITPAFHDQPVAHLHQVHTAHGLRLGRSPAEPPADHRPVAGGPDLLGFEVGVGVGRDPDQNSWQAARPTCREPWGAGPEFSRTQSSASRPSSSEGSCVWNAASN